VPKLVCNFVENKNTCNISIDLTLAGTAVTIVAVEKEKLLYILGVRLFILIYPTCKAHALIILSSLICIALPYFLHYIMNATIFGRELLNLRCVC